MPSHFGLKKIAWLGLAKKQKLLVIVQHIAASVQQWLKKIWLCSQNDDLKIEK
jgi:hypothetical protein